jgi:hypothetical protein
MQIARLTSLEGRLLLPRLSCSQSPQVADAMPTQAAVQARARGVRIEELAQRAFCAIRACCIRSDSCLQQIARGSVCACERVRAVCWIQLDATRFSSSKMARASRSSSGTSSVVRKATATASWAGRQCGLKPVRRVTAIMNVVTMPPLVNGLFGRAEPPSQD